MINVQLRINEMFGRIGEISRRFNKIQNTNNGFKGTLAEIQEKIYNERLSNDIHVKYNHIIKKNAKKYFMPEKLIKSIIKQESNFNSSAISPKGAKGLMQLMPDTASFLGVENVFNPEENIEGGVKYLRMMFNRFNGDVEKALAAYNAGPDAVEKYNGVPDYSETKIMLKIY